MDAFRRYVENHFERLFICLSVLFLVLLSFAAGERLAFLNFYFLPVILAGYYVGKRLSVLGAVFCVAIVALSVALYPGYLRVPAGRFELIFYLMAWGSFLILAGAAVGHQHDRLEKEGSDIRDLHDELTVSYRRLKNARATTVLGLATLAECRDNETGLHLERIREICRILALELRRAPPYDAYITDEYVEDLTLSAVLHDIGKVGVPDAILQKPGKLTPEEYEQMKVHTLLGGDALKAIEAKIEGRSFLTLGKDVAYHHHERWDGRGYPRGIAGADIPLSARIVSVADTYDAITSHRVYAPARPHAEAVRIIREESGRQFDPRVTAAFLAREAAIGELRRGEFAPSPLAAAPAS